MQAPSDKNIPVIDLFAGPGGLGEGFSAFRNDDGTPPFKIRLSIEKDSVAHQTLELRAFFRQFEPGDVPDEYYQHLQGSISRQELFASLPEAADAARREAWCAELGKTSSEAVRKRIHEEIGTNTGWVLIGGPPCQAYSSVGRSRNKGKKSYVPEEDPRQYLYVEYLQILADHQPAVFVMENVKGLLSATLNDQRIFNRILEDLRSPHAAIRRENRRCCAKPLGYHIYSLEQASMFGECELEDFVVRAERHGIPQARHRIILLGVREDLRDVRPCPLRMRKIASVRQALTGLPPLRSGISDGRDDGAVWKDALLDVADNKWFKALGAHGDRDIQDEIRSALENLRIPRKDRGAEFVGCEVSADPEFESWFLDSRIGGVCNHLARTHMVSDLHRYLFAASFGKARKRSPNLKDFPEQLLPNHESVGAALKGGSFGDRFRVQLANRPSTTITCHIAKDGHYYIHHDPAQCRSLTVREAARLQTFPDNYLFCGNRTAQYIQVGNAVPPLLAREIAGVVSGLLG